MIRNRMQNRGASVRSPHLAVTRRRPPGTAFRLFLLLALFYCLDTSGHIYTPDGVVMGRVAQSIAAGRGFAVDPRGIPPDFIYQGTDGRSYGKYGPGFSLVSVPFAVLGGALHRMNPGWSVDLFTGPKVLWYRAKDPADDWSFFGLALVNAFVVAASCALLFRLARRIGFSARTSLVVAAIAGFASPLWPYAKDSFAEPLGGLGLVGFALAAEEYASSRRGRLALMAGLALGLAAWAKIAHAAVLPVTALVMLSALSADRLHGRAGPAARASALRDLLLFAGGLAAMLAVVAWFNLVRFGSVTTTGYEKEIDRWSTPVLTGIRGLLLSPGHGLLPYFPVALIAIFATRSFRRRSGRMALMAWGTLAALVLLYCRWYAWYGGWAFGPRFLVPAIPFLALLAAPWVERLSPSLFRGSTASASSGGTAALARWGGALAVAASFWLALTGSLVPTTDFHQQALETWKGSAPYYERLWWSWSAFPGWAYWSFTPKGFTLVARALREPSGWWIAGLFGAGLVCLIALARSVVLSVLSDDGAVGGSRGPADTAAASVSSPTARPVLSSRNLAWTASALGAAAVLALVSWSSGPHVSLQYDFEGTSYGPGWQQDGAAFGTGPAQGPFGEQKILGAYGRGLINTFAAGDAATGTLRSPEFVVRGNRASFLIGGSRDPRVGVRLVSAGREIARATSPGPPDPGTPGVDGFARATWDISAVDGQRAALELIDASPGGHLLFDDFRIYRAR